MTFDPILRSNDHQPKHGCKFFLIPRHHIIEFYKVKPNGPRQSYSTLASSSSSCPHVWNCSQGSLDTESGWRHFRKWGRTESLTLLYTYPIFGFMPLEKNARIFAMDTGAKYFLKGSRKSNQSSKHLGQKVVMKVRFFSLLVSWGGLAQCWAQIKSF